MKARNLIFFISANGELMNVSFHNSEGASAITSLNIALQDQLPEIREWVKEVAVEKFTPVTVSEKLSLDTRKLESIHF